MAGTEDTGAKPHAADSPGFLSCSVDGFLTEPPTSAALHTPHPPEVRRARVRRCHPPASGPLGSHSNGAVAVPSAVRAAGGIRPVLLPERTSFGRPNGTSGMRSEHVNALASEMTSRRKVIPLHPRLSGRQPHHRLWHPITVMNSGLYPYDGKVQTHGIWCMCHLSYLIWSSELITKQSNEPHERTTRRAEPRDSGEPPGRARTRANEQPSNRHASKRTGCPRSEFFNLRFRGDHDGKSDVMRWMAMGKIAVRAVSNMTRLGRRLSS